MAHFSFDVLELPTTLSAWKQVVYPRIILSLMLCIHDNVEDDDDEDGVVVNMVIIHPSGLV